MDAVVNPPRPGEASYESWDAEVKGVLASLKESVFQIFKLKIVPEGERERTLHCRLLLFSKVL